MQTGRPRSELEWLRVWEGDSVGLARDSVRVDKLTQTNTWMNERQLD